jgi:Zn-dependent metalloprotease
MKSKNSLLFFIFSIAFAFSQNNRTIIKNEILDSKSGLGLLEFEQHAFSHPDECANFIIKHYIRNHQIKAKAIKSEADEFGFHHTSYQLTYGQYPIQNKIIKVHVKDGNWRANGELQPFYPPANQIILNENASLNSTLNKIKAKKYKWELQDETEHVRRVTNNPNFTYYPKGELVLISYKDEYRYAWKFDIYSHEPLNRAVYFVDAQTGKILDIHQKICTINVTGTAHTKYSGVKTFTIDQNGSTYRLRENAKGQGVETYNLQNGTNYGAAVDFTNTSTTWSLSGLDHGVVDAHWGAEMSYDYYMQIHNRNSLDNNGFKLLSYCHYSSNYNNAFWDGQRMTYGDGNQTSMTIFTCLDVCGHEFTHGLTEFTGNLVYQNEPGALNESWSDIFGTCIENFGKPSGWNWKIGNEITTNNQGIRDMQNPKLFADPNCYMGQYWYTGTADNGGVHTNSGVGNFWFYLLTAGGTGTNDIGNSYTVTGIGMTPASRIAFRAMTVYFTPNTNYANARALTIQAAKDLYGNCSNEVIQCTNAWYACGVGPAWSSSVSPNFVATNTVYCSLPATVQFQNTTANGNSYIWYFGNGATSTSVNPVYTYTSPGNYTVKLKAFGCASAVDSIIKTAYIQINLPSSPVASGTAICQNQNAVLSASGSGQIVWYASPTSTTPLQTGNTYTTPNLSSNTTYYVVNQVTNTPVSGGILSNTATGTGGGQLNNPAHYLIFDVVQPCTLVSVNVYAAAAGTRTFELRNSSNVVLASWVFNLNAGLNTLTLNQNMSLGTSYQLGLNAASTGSLFRTNSGVSYPYNISAGINITGSSAGSGFYYWFYNWVVQKAPCKSNAVPVTVTVTPSGPSTITASSNNVCAGGPPVNLSATPSGGTFSGTGVSGNQFIPPTTPGNYNITYLPPGGCASAGQTTIQVNSLPNVSVNSATICQGQSANLTASGASSYSWNTGSNAASIIVSPSNNATYVVTGTSAQGCTNTAVANVVVNPLPNVTASASQTLVCTTDGPVSLSGSPNGGTFSGTGVSGTQFNPSVGSGTYAILYSYTDSNGCSNSSGFSIVVNACLGINQLNPNPAIQLCPNPFKDHLLILNQNFVNTEITVFDATGKRIYENNIIQNEAKNINTSVWAPGIYLIQIKNVEINKILKFIKE